MKIFFVLGVIFFIIILIIIYTVSKKELYLFSQVKGTVTINGKVVPQAKISQEVVWSWNREKISREITTDDKGMFSFPPVIVHGFFVNILPAEVYNYQSIFITYEGVTYDGWLYDKTDYYNNSELRGSSLDLICDLKNKKEHFGNNSTSTSSAFPYSKDKAYGICRLAIADSN